MSYVFMVELVDPLRMATTHDGDQQHHIIDRSGQVGKVMLPINFSYTTY